MHQYKVTDIDSMSTEVGESKQHCCDMQDNINEKVDDTDLRNNVTMTSEDRTVSQSTESDVNLEVKNILKQMEIDKSKSVSFKSIIMTFSLNYYQEVMIYIVQNICMHVQIFLSLCMCVQS